MTQTAQEKVMHDGAASLRADNAQIDGVAQIRGTRDLEIEIYQGFRGQAVNRRVRAYSLGGTFFPTDKSVLPLEAYDLSLRFNYHGEEVNAPVEVKAQDARSILLAPGTAQDRAAV